jgi:exopolysaccharide biosynthesis polyprenyl glycosylphosphotransferase
MNSLFGRIAAGKVARLSFFLDLALIVGAVLASAVISDPDSSVMLPSGLWFSGIALVTWLFTSMALRHYDPWASERQILDDLALVTILVMAVTTMLAAGSLVYGVAARLPQVGIFLLVFWPSAIAVRILIFRAFSKKEDPLDEVLIVGIGALGRATSEDIARRGKRNLLGYVRFSAETVSPHFRGKLLGSVGELETVLSNVPVGEVYLASNNLTHAEEMQRAVKVCERLGVPFAMPAYFFRLDRARPLASHAVSDGYIHYQSVTFKPTQMALKRLFDITASAVALWFLVPLFLVVAMLIKLTSRGPLLFRQTRVGINGRPFKMLKFRTMVEDAEALKAKLAEQNEMDGPVFKMKKDPRITTVGRFLRKFSIDELPQLINVLRGDMSIVGPRPPVPQEVAKYEAWQRRRLSVRPGLTCIWQVSGRNQISFEEWMYMDMQYIDHWSFWKDVRLILKTVPVVITGHGAS